MSFGLNVKNQTRKTAGTIGFNANPVMASDTIPAMLSPGEAVLNPIATKVAGPANIDALNRTTAPLLPPSSRTPVGFGCGGRVQGYASGGIADWMGEHTGGLIGTSKNVLETKKRMAELDAGAPIPDEAPAAPAAPPVAAAPVAAAPAPSMLQNLQDRHSVIDRASGFGMGGIALDWENPGDQYDLKKDLAQFNKQVGSTPGVTPSAFGAADTPQVRAETDPMNLRQSRQFIQSPTRHGVVMASRGAEGTPPRELGQTPTRPTPDAAGVWGGMQRSGGGALAPKDSAMDKITDSVSRNIVEPYVNRDESTVIGNLVPSFQREFVEPAMTPDSDPVPIAGGKGPLPQNLQDKVLGTPKPAIPVNETSAPPVVNRDAKGGVHAQGIDVSSPDRAGLDRVAQGLQEGRQVPTYDSKTYADTAVKEAQHAAGMARLRAGGSYDAPQAPAYGMRAPASGPDEPIRRNWWTPDPRQAAMQEAMSNLNRHGEIGDAFRRRDARELLGMEFGMQKAGQDNAVQMRGQDMLAGTHAADRDLTARGQDMQLMGHVLGSRASGAGDVKTQAMEQWLATQPPEIQNQARMAQFGMKDPADHYANQSIDFDTGELDSMGHPMKLQVQGNVVNGRFKAGPMAATQLAQLAAKRFKDNNGLDWFNDFSDERDGYYNQLLIQAGLDPLPAGFRLTKEGMVVGPNGQPAVHD